MLQSSWIFLSLSLSSIPGSSIQSWYPFMSMNGYRFPLWFLYSSKTTVEANCFPWLEYPISIHFSNYYLNVTTSCLVGLCFSYEYEMVYPGICELQMPVKTANIWFCIFGYCFWTLRTECSADILNRNQIQSSALLQDFQLSCCSWTHLSFM